MKILRLSLVNFKRIVKDIKTILLMMLMPLIVITGINYFSSKDTDTNIVKVAINVEDNGNYGKQLIKDLNISSSVYYHQKDKALEPLKKNDVVAVYEVPADFTEKIKEGIKPEIIGYKNKDGNGTTPLEGDINQWINEKCRENILINNKIIKGGKEITKGTIKTVIQGSKKGMEDNMFMTIMLLLNFVIFSALGVGTEILNLKKQKILSRAITTANRGWEIIGSIYIAQFLAQVLVYSLIFIVQICIFGYSLSNFYIILINIALMSLVSISLGVFVTRICENEALASLLINIVASSTTFLSIAGILSDTHKTSWVVENLTKFAPQYWAMKSIDSSALFPNVIIIMLMALALFTAGNFRVRNFVNR